MLELFVAMCIVSITNGNVESCSVDLTKKYHSIKDCNLAVLEKGISKPKDGKVQLYLCVMPKTQV